MNGIGGRTIAEAQERLSHAEFWTWVQYRARRGSLHLGMRVERGAALLATLYHNAHAKEPKELWEFMPYADQPPPAPISLEEAMENWE